MPLCRETYEELINRKIGELQEHRDTALKQVLRAYDSHNGSLFDEATAIFEASKPTLEGLVELKDVECIAVDSLIDLMTKVELTSQLVHYPGLMSEN